MFILAHGNDQESLEISLVVDEIDILLVMNHLTLFIQPASCLMMNAKVSPSQASRHEGDCTSNLTIPQVFGLTVVWMQSKLGLAEHTKHLLLFVSHKGLSLTVPAMYPFCHSG